MNDHDRNKIQATRAAAIIKMYQIDVSASICSNFNIYLTVVLSI